MMGIRELCIGVAHFACVLVVTASEPTLRALIPSRITGPIRLRSKQRCHQFVGEIGVTTGSTFLCSTGWNETAFRRLRSPRKKNCFVACHSI